MPTGNAQLAAYRSGRPPGPAAVVPPGSIRGPLFRSSSRLKFDSRGGWAGVAREAGWPHGHHAGSSPGSSSGRPPSLSTNLGRHVLA
jgi:hypothetical protein